MAAPSSARRPRALFDRLHNIEKELREFQAQFAELCAFIKQNSLTPSGTTSPHIDISPTSTLSSTYQSKSHRISTIYAQTTLQLMRARLTAFDIEVAEGTAMVKEQKARLRWKIRLGDVDNYHEWSHLDKWIPGLRMLGRWGFLSKGPDGGNWGYLAEWVTDIQKLHAAIKLQFRETQFRF